MLTVPPFLLFYGHGGVGNEELTADDKEQDNTCQNIGVGMIQSKIGRDLTGTAIHENDQEAGEHHGQRIELGHPGYQYSGKSLSTCNGGGHSMVDAAYQKQGLPVRTEHRTKHGTDDYLFYLDTHIFCGIFAFTHNGDLISLLAVVEIYIHENRDHYRHYNT